VPLIIHKDLPGAHDTTGNGCWCGPVVVEEDDIRTTEELIEASKIAEC